MLNISKNSLSSHLLFSLKSTLLLFLNFLLRSKLAVFSVDMGLIFRFSFGWNFLSLDPKSHSFSFVLLSTLCCSQSLDCVFATPWTVAHQAPLFIGILQARILEWIAMPPSRESSQPRDRTQFSCIAGRFFTVWATREAQIYCTSIKKKKRTLYKEREKMACEGYLKVPRSPRGSHLILSSSATEPNHPEREVIN